VNHKGGWVIREYCGEKHVMPVGEIHSWFHCKCLPRRDAEDESVIVHNSFDEREKFETGARLPS
jgi:hypothetical protein